MPRASTGVPLDITEVLSYKRATPGQRRYAFLGQHGHRLRGAEASSSGRCPPPPPRPQRRVPALASLDHLECRPLHRRRSSQLALIKEAVLRALEADDNADGRWDAKVDSDDADASKAELHTLPTVPAAYPVLCELPVLDTLLAVGAARETTDISIAVIDLIEEMTDTDVLAENPDDTEQLIAKLMDAQLVMMLVQNLDRIIENLCEARPDCLEQMASKQGLLACLLKRIGKRGFSPNKLYASELLAILFAKLRAQSRLLAERRQPELWNASTEEELEEEVYLRRCGLTGNGPVHPASWWTLILAPSVRMVAAKMLALFGQSARCFNIAIQSAARRARSCQRAPGAQPMTQRRRPGLEPLLAVLL
uniref:DUF1716 domain-containing protein n=1 Tax=Macrostomum lignano TaxID=282301 RepID=A0A1I8FAJ8_9PLAT